MAIFLLYIYMVRAREGRRREKTSSLWFLLIKELISLEPYPHDPI
jgi:hypothetical protein